MPQTRQRPVEDAFYRLARNFLKAAAQASFGARVSPSYPNPILLTFTDFLYVPVPSNLYLYIAIPASIVAPDAYSIADNLAIS
jgi:hypothetical protein